MRSYQCGTDRLTQGFFTCRALGLQDLKGISTPMALYQVQGESGVQGRFAATLTTGLLPLVEIGRGREQASLAALGTGQGWNRTGGTPEWGARNWQITSATDSKGRYSH